MTPAAALSAALARDLPPGTGRVGLAVSGGGDSLALMVLAADWARASGACLRVATVDHGLRPEAASEASFVAASARALGLAHDTLDWRGHDGGWDGRGNLQARAREARYGLLTDWAQAQRLDAVFLGHTLDDQAETVLLRLARGSGVDGLAGIAPVRRDRAGGPLWLRPLLGVRRAALREVLRARGLDWIEDPGNDDPRFDRVRARRALALCGVPGLDGPTLAETATRMAAARRVLQGAAFAAARTALRVDHGAIGLDAAQLATLPDDTRWRLLSAALCRVGGQVYRPRLKALHRAEAAIAAGRRHVLAGCAVSVERGRSSPATIWIDREPAALTGRRAPVPGDWDGRWRIEGPPAPDLHLAALGPEGLAQRPGWRAAGLRRAALLTAPGIWQGTRLVAAPSLPAALDDGRHWQCRPVWDKIAACGDLCPD